MPLDIALLFRQRAGADLKQTHRHARPHLGQLDALPARAHKHVMPHLDAILDVLERHHAIAHLGAAAAARDRLARGEDVLEDLHDAGSQGRAESFEDEVRVGFGDGAARRGGQVVPQQDVV